MDSRNIIKVLLIEDNPGDIRLISEMLKESLSLDLDLFQINSLHEIKKIEEKDFDIVLLDLHYDDITGMESYSYANILFPLKPIIVLTGLSDEKLAYDIVKLGAQDYILKDNVDSKGLVRAIRYAIERKSAEIQKDEFLGFASHELKTPVTSIKAYIQLMEHQALRKEGSPKIDTLLPFIRKVDAQVDKLTHLINDLLDVTKVNAGKMEFNFENFLIDEVVNESIENMQLITTKHKIIKKGKSTSYVMADKERTCQILVNLLSNAIKYSPNSDIITVNVMSDKDKVSIAVQDFGIGISKEEQCKIFDRYYRVDVKNKETYPGLGLGLYIASEIAKRQNGRLYIESKKGQGSTFYFELPVISSKTAIYE